MTVNNNITMSFQFKTGALIITILLFLFTGISLGSFLYAPKATNHLIYGGITLFPALTLLMKARVNPNSKSKETSN